MAPLRRDGVLNLFAVPSGFFSSLSKSEPYENQSCHGQNKWPGSSEKTIEPGGGVEPVGFSCVQRATAPAGRHDARDEQEQTMTDAQVAALPILMLLRKELSAWLACPSAWTATFKRRPEQVDDYAQRPCLSDPDPWLIDSGYVIE